MVFESLVVELVNKYLGDFIENLDTSQLKIGIWGGDVVLNNLFIKQSALDDLDLPVKVLHGNIGKLVLKVPWKNLYTEPTIATLEGLYVVAVPNSGIKYEDEKEKKTSWEAKQKELQRIDDAKKAAADKNKPSDPKADSFAEKLATNVIKNLQVHVRDVHIRYEDKFSNPAKPYALGVTLKGLLFQTTDEKWMPTTIKDAVAMIHKLVQLDSLAMYWNTKAQIYTDFNRDRLQAMMQKNIADPQTGTDYCYMVEPISSSAKLRLNTKPENDKFTIPKVLLNVLFEQIGIALTKGQFQNIMEVLESFERMNLSSKYRKYQRPVQPIKGRSKEWWRYAYRAVMGETVQRRRQMFSWQHILHHRNLCKEYKNVYKKKLGLKKIPADLTKQLETLEKELTVFNITLNRQQAELEVIWERQRRVAQPHRRVAQPHVWDLYLMSAALSIPLCVMTYMLMPIQSVSRAIGLPLDEAKKEGIKKQKSGGGGWLSGWWGGGKKATEQEEEKIGDQFQKLMSDDEKAKLYQALGYEESVGDPTLPTEYVANELNFKLNAISITLKDDERKLELVKVSVNDTTAKLVQRPAANAVGVNAKMDSFTVIGAPAIDGSNPLMVSSQNKEANLTYSLLDLMFETNPLDGECDVRVKLNTRPLEIIYDANTINQIAEFFKPPESVHLAQIQSAAMAKFEELKEQTATGLQHTIEQRKYTEIAVDLKPTYVLIPEKGVYRKDAQMLVLDLGSLKVKSKKQERTATTPTDGAPLSKEEIMQKAYDQFDITLAHFQLLYAGRGAEWQAARQLDNSPLHILKPMGLTVSLFKSFLEDVSLPKMKIRGVLPSLNIGISDKRLEEVLCLVNSIPFPEGAPAPPEEELAIPSAPNIAETIAQEGSASQLVKKFVVEDSSSDEEGQPKPKKAPLQKQTSKEYVNMTDVDLQFEIKEICVNLSQRQNDQDIPLIKLVIDSLGTSVKVRTFDLQVTAYLGGIYVQHMQFKASPEVAKFYSSETALHEGPLINLVNTPVTDDTTFKLLTVTYLKANKKGPEFKTVYKNTEQSIDVHFSALEVLLHQEAIVNILEFAQNLQAALAASSPSKTDTTPNVDTMSVPSKIRRTSSALFLGTTPTSSSSSMSKIRRARMMKEEETIDIAVKASLDVFAVAVCNQKNLITDVKIKGLEANIGVLKSKTTISASLKDITVYDPASDALYPKILTFEGGEVFSMNIIAFNGATEGDNYSNMACVDTSILLITGCMKIVFLNKFVNSLLKFLQQFQTAMDKAKEKGLAAAESAANAAKDFSAKASRVKLDVKLKAPVVVIPQNSKSGNTVVADLGNISVSNTFSMPGKYSPDKVPAVLDKMVVELSSLKLSRALMMGTDMRAECVILDPVNIKLGVTRNLAAGWYHGHPDVDIYGNLDNFSVAMSQGDYTTIMSILTENLQEGQDEVQKIPSDASQPSKQDIEVPTESTITAEVAGTVASSAHDVAGTGAKKDVAEVHSTLEFNFSIQSIRAELFTGDSNLDSGQTQRDAKLSLALFELQQIGAEGKMLSNSSIKAKVSLHRIVLQDTRPGKEKGITKMVQQSTLGTSDASGQHMINVDFTQLANLNKDLKTEVKGLYICVCLEYLMAVGDFFTKGLPQAKPVPPTPSTAIEPTVSKTSATGTQSAPAVMAQETKQSTAPPAATGDINILLTVDNPEIILVENAMDPNTNALILETAVLFKMRISPESQTMSGTVAKLQIMSCIFAEEKREASKCLILKPTDISLNLNAPQGKGHHIAIMVGDIVMTISPAIIRTVTATLGALSKPAEEEEENKASKVPKNLWDVKNLKDCDNLWYTKPAKEESTESAVSLLEEEETDEETESRGEQLMMQVKRITVTLEGGIGRRTIPLIITEMTFHAEVKDWSSRLRVSADTALEIAYYNENLAVWEPLIEPVEDESRLRPWEISLEVLQNELLPPPPPEGEDEADGGVVMPSPKMTINVLSKDILQVTISKTCLDVLTKLGKSFNDAYNLVEQQEKVDEVLAPYTISNETGRALLVDLDNTLKMPSNAVDGRVELHSEDKLHLYNTEAVQKMLAEKSVIKSTQQELRKKISVTLADFGIKKELKIMKAENKAFSLQHKSLGTDPWHMICQTDASYGSKTVNLRSIVQITNHLPFPMELYYKMSDDATGRCGEVPSGGVFSIPLDAVYSKPHEIYFKPRDANYAESGHSFKWKDYKEPKDALEKVVSCLPSKDPDLPPVCFYLKTETEDVIVDGTDDKKVTSYMVNLYPCVTFRNLLPLPLHYKLPGSSEYSVMEAGNKATFVNAMPGETKIDFKIEKYLEKDWTGSKLIEENPQDLSVLGFESELGSVIDLGIHCNKQHGYQELSLYCPYWMVNKTGRDLSYKAGDDFAMLHPGDKQGIVLFSFRSKSFFGKKKDEHDTASICSSNSTNSASPSKKKRKLRSPFKKKAVPLKTDNSVSLQKAVKASLKVSDSDWSDKFSLDTVGSSGTVTCKLKGKTYEEESPSKKSPKKAPTLSSKNIGRTLTTAAQIGASVGSPPKEHRSKPNSKRSPVKIKVGVNIQLSSSGLTKIVTFTPYFMLINQATYPICCKEVDITEEQWWEVGPGDCLPFWPMQTDKIKQMVVKVKDTTEESLPFCFTDAHTTLLKLSNEHGGVNVVCDCQESAVEIMLQEYKPGYASVRLVNMLTNSAVEYIQGGMKDAKPVALQPDQTVLYTWENPKGKRELLWTCGDKKQQKNDLLKDHIDSFYYNSDTKWYWVSFLDGMQRVLLFTEDFVIATLALQAGELERLDQEINLSLQGMGLSLVNNLIQKEVAYMGITSSGVIWEEKKKKRFKALKVKQSAIIEAAYEKFVAEISVGKNPATHMKLEQKLEIDFGNNPPMMIKPRKCAIKRSYENGIWLQYRTSAHQLQFHMKIHRLQLDNQLPGAVFPTVLAPIPPPKSVAADSVPKPFTEMSIMIRKKEYSPVMQFKYFKVLTQEMSVKVDQGFLNALILLFASEEADEESKRAMFKQDMAVIDKKLLEYAVQSSADEQKHFYDMLHVSPLKVHLSFSLYGAEKDKDKPMQLQSDVLNLFLQSVGIVLTDVQDVVFKLGYFERKFQFYNQSQLTSEVVHHYSSQAIKQMYVLVLGLDVLGNPFGVIRGLAEGIEDLFYEPYQGAVQGPEEFAEGLALGVRSLLGHAVGGAAGAVSRITGALGKGIATLTLDDDYQKKRREQLNKRPADFKEGLARGGKGLVMGVFDGVTGIVRKPVEGAKEEGVAGFFKGVGKGLVGVVTRPTSGVVDFASGTFEGVKRVAEMSDEVRRLRPPRFLHKDGIVRPYVHKEAEGNDTLQDVEKGKYALTDTYIGHVVITKDLKNVLVVTDKRILFASKGEIFGHWDCDWQYSWEELKEPPTLTNKGIQILLKEKEKKSFFKSGTMGKVIPMEDRQTAAWLVKKMHEIMQQSK